MAKRLRLVSVGQLVWAPDTKTTPGTWPLARIIILFPDSNGTTRVVDVKTIGGVLRRSIRNLVIVPQRQ